MRRVLLLPAIVLSVVACARPAAASTAQVTVDSVSTTLDKATGGGWTTSVAMTNLTDAPIALSVVHADSADPDCTVTPDPAMLPPARHTSVKFTFPADCKVSPKGAMDFAVSAGLAATFAITASPTTDTAPDWNALWAFPWALLAALLLAAPLFRVNPKDYWPPYKPLKYLDQTYSFKDSWVSNVTVIGGLLTGVFGSSTVVTALGTDAKNAVALATVGAAVAAAFIAAGPILLLSTKDKEGYITTGGLLAAAALTLGGASGELWTVYKSGASLDLGGWQNRLVIPLAIGFALLALYSFRAAVTTLQHGTTKPPAVPPSPTIVAARMVVEALKAQPSVNAVHVQSAIDSLTPDDFKVQAGPVEPEPHRRRTALL